MSPEEAAKMVRGLEHLSNECSWEKALGRSYSTFSTWTGPIGEQDRDFLQGHIVIGQGEITLNWDLIRYLLWGWDIYYEDGEALELVVQRSCRFTISGSVQSWVGWGFEHHHLLESVPVHSRVVGTGKSLRSLQPKLFCESLMITKMLFTRTSIMISV